MNTRLIPRAAAVTLALLVTVTTLSGIDVLAVNGHAGHARMAALPASSVTAQQVLPPAAPQAAAETTPAPRS